jgi:hypothetical protein
MKAGQSIKSTMHTKAVHLHDVRNPVKQQCSVTTSQQLLHQSVQCPSRRATRYEGFCNNVLHDILMLRTAPAPANSY